MSPVFEKADILRVALMVHRGRGLLRQGSILGRKGGQGQGLGVELELAAADKARLAAETNRRLSARSPWRRREEALDRRLRYPPLDRALEGVERVAAEELEVEAGEDVRAADVVEADDLARDRDQCAGLAVSARQRLRVSSSVAPRSTYIASWAPVGRSSRAAPTSRRRCSRPRSGRGRRRVLVAAKLRVGGARRGREAARAVRPAARLDAGDRDVELGAGRDEDRPLEDAVLLGADELLALVEEDALLQRVDEAKGGTEPASSTSVTARPQGPPRRGRRTRPRRAPRRRAERR